MTAPHIGIAGLGDTLEIARLLAGKTRIGAPRIPA